MNEKFVGNENFMISGVAANMLSLDSVDGHFDPESKVIQLLEEDNERLRAENAQLREKCLRYRAALAALIN